MSNDTDVQIVIFLAQDFVAAIKMMSQRKRSTMIEGEEETVHSFEGCTNYALRGGVCKTHDEKVKCFTDVYDDDDDDDNNGI